MESLTPQPTGQARGLIFELRPQAPGGLPGGDLFEREVQRTLEREGGRAAVDERRGRLSDSRRADRRAGFESGPSDRRRSAEPDVPQDRQAPATPAAPVAESPPRELTNESASRSASQTEGASREGQATEGGAKRGPQAGDGPPPQTRGASTPAAAAQPAAAGAANQPLGALPQVRPQAGAQPVVTGAGAVGGLRGAANGADAAPKVSLPAPPPPPDTEAVERAAEVLRQLRARLSTRGVGGAGREVLLQLAPRELGRLTVRMRLENGSLSTVVRVESAQTLELLERQSPELRALLSQQGFEAEQLDLQLFEGSPFQSGSSGARRDAARGSSPGPPSDPQDSTTQDTDHPTLPPRHVVQSDAVDTYA